jgi:hypothetical protein
MLGVDATAMLVAAGHGLPATEHKALEGGPTPSCPSSAFATFDTPFEVTTSELAIELLFPADRGTAEALRTVTRDRRRT